MKGLPVLFLAAALAACGGGPLPPGTTPVHESSHAEAIPPPGRRFVLPGDGVTVGVYDSGFYNRPDADGNPWLHWEFDPARTTLVDWPVTRIDQGAFEWHGSRVASVLAARRQPIDEVPAEQIPSVLTD